MHYASDEAGLAWLNATGAGVSPPTSLSLSHDVALSASRLAGEWKSLNTGLQSGLRYGWQDGLPFIPETSPSREAMLSAKRVMDIALACALLLFFLPALILVAIAIKATSKGPVFFMQERVGLRNGTFRVYKFRTMYTDRQDETGVMQTVADDHRITPIGRLLRRISVDEVPQIINILKGEMSFVGPRPHVPGMLAAGVLYEELVPYYDLRHVVKPGLTGWAQANGFRGPTSDPAMARARVDHDITYIQNFSLWLDITIIVKTAWREFITGTGV
ncbi:MAG TPA: sugar transferase [Arsenicitalea sp.]|nr:sugar transferase [Arsenicitalea sp.]